MSFLDNFQAVRTRILIISIILAVILAALVFYLNKSEPTPSLFNTADVPSTAVNEICLKVSMPDDLYTCAIGACGCAPEHSHEVKICDCGKDRCFNGVECAVFTGRCSGSKAGA